MKAVADAAGSGKLIVLRCTTACDGLFLCLRCAAKRRRALSWSSLLDQVNDLFNSKNSTYSFSSTNSTYFRQARHTHEYAGGAQDLRPGNCYYDAMAHIMDWAMADFDLTKEVFPIHFTCLGWEAVAVKLTQNPYILGSFFLSFSLLCNCFIAF